MKKGLLLFVAGSVMMLLATWVSFRTVISWPLVLPKVIPEPAEWFLIWAAFDLLFYDLTEIRKEKIFFRELSRLQIHFKTS